MCVAAAVFAIGYYLIIKGNRETLSEMRQERLSGGRPQVMVETGLLNLPVLEFVVRNVSGGAAKGITLELSGSIEESSGFVISELRYIREGIPFLGPGERIYCVWDYIDRLIPYFRQKGLQEGIAVKVRFKDLSGESYTTDWRVNPLLYEGLRYDASQLSRGPSGSLPEPSSTGSSQWSEPTP